MTPLSWNEIRSRAIRFSKDWENAEKESAESQTFWNEFFNVFGISRRRVATFEWKAVHNDDRPDGFVDVLWPNTLIIEQKSRVKNLNRTYAQSKAKRIKFLFHLYEKYSQPLAAENKINKREKNKDVNVSLLF